MVNQNILTRLELISANVGLPISHKGDLVMDARLMSESTGTFIWFLKPAGTVTIPVGKGVNPAYVETFMTLPHAAFFVNGDVMTPLNDQSLLYVLHQEPIEFDLITSMKQLVDKVERVLRDPVINGDCNRELQLTPIECWTSWQDKFHLYGNDLMERVMQKAIMKANDFEKESCNA